MRIDVRSHAFHVSDALRLYAQRHIAARLERHVQRVQWVVVRLDDVNGGKGGVDKVCRIEVWLPGLAPVVVEELDHDVREAMNLAADRIDRAVSRHCDRTWESRPHKALGRRVRAWKEAPG